LLVIFHAVNKNHIPFLDLNLQPSDFFMRTCKKHVSESNRVPCHFSNLIWQIVSVKRPLILTSDIVRMLQNS